MPQQQKTVQGMNKLAKMAWSWIKIKLQLKRIKWGGVLVCSVVLYKLVSFFFSFSVDGFILSNPMCSPHLLIPISEADRLNFI